MHNNLINDLVYQWFVLYFRYLKYVTVSRTRATVRLRRTVTSTGTYEKEVKCKKYTIGLILISALQVILHHINYDSKIFNKYLEFEPCKKMEIHRYLTYMFLHRCVKNSKYLTIIYNSFSSPHLKYRSSWY